MTHRKLSDKFKIFLAVAVVVAVAVAAIAYVALSTNGSDALATLSAGQAARSVSDDDRESFSAPQVDSNGRNVYTGDYDHKISVQVKVAEIGSFYFDEYFEISVTGVDFENKEITDIDVGENSYDCLADVFDVFYAGTYTVSVRLLDTEYYKWADVEGDTITTEFILQRASIATVAITDMEDKSLEDKSYSPDMTVESLKKDIKANCSYEDSTGNSVKVAKATVELYSDSSCKTLLKDADIKAGKTIYVKAGETLLPLSDGDKTYRNFVLTDSVRQSGVASFKITGQTISAPSIHASTAQGTVGIVEYYTSGSIRDMFPDVDHMPMVTGTTVTAMYMNYDYKISHWFDQETWNKGLENGGYAKGEYWNVTVNDSPVDPETYKMKDVGTYTVKITPKDESLSFGTTNEYSFKMVINPYRLLAASNFEWKDNKREYTGSGIEFGAEDCLVVNLPNSAQDDVTVVLERVDFEGTTVINENPIVVGTYHYRVKSIEGNDKGKYTLPINAIKGEVTIYRKELPDFSQVGPVVTGTFNGKEQSISVMEDFIKWGLVLHPNEILPDYILSGEFDATISYPQSWGLGNATQSARVILGPMDVFDKNHPENYDKNAYFVFTYAGNYSITLAAGVDSTLGANYCWHGQDNKPSAQLGTYVWENFAKIDRLEIDPSLPSYNISINDTYVNLADLFATKFSGIDGGDKDVYTLTYGSGSTTSPTPIDKESDGTYKEGVYFVRVTISDEFYPSVGFKAATSGEYKITNNGKTAELSYEVNSNTVSIRCAVTNYTFGANFASGFGLSNVFDFTYGGIKEEDCTNKTYKFYTDSDRTQEVAAADMVNGLPRNAGKYYVRITADYTFNGENDSKVIDCELTVDKRQASLAWTLDGTATAAASASFTYNGNPHTVAVDNTTAAGVPNVTVELSAYSATNAGTHTFTVALAGDEADNYTLDDVTNTTFTITIAPAQITVTASDVSNVEYGNALTLPNPAYTITGINAFTTAHGNEISVAVYDASGSLVNVSNYGSLSRGAYRVVPVYGTADDTIPTLTGDRYVISDIDNYVITMVVDSFSVTSPALEITLHSGASTQYGDVVDLYVPYDSENGTGVYSTNIEISVEEFKQLIELTATWTKSGVTYQVTDNKAPVGTYALNATVKIGNGDYEITVKYVGAATSATYNIVRRKITLQAMDVTDHPFGSTYYIKDSNGQNKYNHYEMIGSILPGDESEVKIGYGVYEIYGGGSSKTDVTGGLYEDVCTVDKTYCHLVKINGSAGNLTPESNNRYSYTKTTANYEVKVVSGKFEMVAREIELTFSNTASVVYGTTINYWTQPGDLSGKNLYSVYDYCTAANLRYGISGGGSTDEKIHADYLKDVIDLTLVNYDGNKGTYTFKATVKDSFVGSYVIKDGQNDGKELTGGQLTVTAKDITITVTASANFIVYGNDLNGITLDFTVNGLVDGDSKTDLGMTVGIYSGNTDVTSSIATQNVGASYVVKVSDCTNSNYNVTSVTTASFAITKRTITLTFTENGGASVYGESVTVDDLYGAAVGELTNLTNGHTYKNVVALSAVNGSDNVTDANAPAKTYTITATLNSEYEANYTLSVSGQGKYVIAPRKVVLKPTAVNHDYNSAYDATAPAYSIEEGSFLSKADETAMQIVAVITNGDGQNVTDSIATQPAGSYTLSLSVTNVNTNYDVDVTTTASFEIVVRAAQVQFKNNLGNVYGAPVSLAALKASIRDNVLFTIAGLVDGDENSVTVSIVKLDDSSVNAIDNQYAPVGQYVVTVSLGGNYDVEYANWQYEDTRGAAYEITPRSVKLVADGKTHTYGDTFNVSDLTYSTSSSSDYSVLENDKNSLGVNARVLNGTNEITDFAALDVKAGGYVIELYKGANVNANYELSLENGTFTVTQRAITLTFGNGGTSVYGETVDLYNAISSNSSLVNGHQLKNVVILTATKGSDSATATKAPVGEYTVTATISPSYSVNYKLADDTSTGVYNLTKRSVKIVANDVSHTYGNTYNVSSIGYTVAGDSAYTVLGGDNLGITAQVLDGVVEVTNFTTLAVKDGGYVIRLSNGTNANYSVTPVDGTFTVNNAEITDVNVTSGHATGVYTGESYKLFDIMTATTVNNQDITWYYREVGKDNWTEYDSDALATVCSKQFEVKATALNHNDKVYATYVSFAITQNSITIKADDKEITYGSDINVVKFSGQLSGSDNGLLSTVVDSYIKAVTYSAIGYTVTTDAGSEIDITSTYTGDDNVAVTVSKGTLTVNKREITATFDNSKTSVYGVQVTQSVVDSLCSVSGLVNGDTVTVTAKKGETSLTSDKAPAGTYTVTISTDSNNYTIHYNNGESGTYEITKRVITASLDKNSVTYTEDGSDYHGGVYGAEHNAVVNFDSLVDGDTLSLNSSNGYTVTYNTVTIDDWQVAGNAPRKVGEYQVTVTLNNSNYTFANDKTTAKLSFEVTKKAIDASQLAWNQNTIEYLDQQRQDNHVNGYIAAIMELVSATKITAQQMQAGDDPTPLVLGNSETGDCYYFDDEVLHIVAFGRAEYKVKFILNSDAQANYQLVNMPNGATEVELAFYVITENATVTINSAGWQYLAKVDDKVMNVLVSGKTPMYGTSYQYAPVKDGADITALLQRKQADGYGGFDLEDVNDLFDSLSALDWAKANFDVGYYVICVIYDTFDRESEDVEDLLRATKYDLVQVSRKQLNMPTTLESKPFDGKTQGQDIIFIMSNNENIQELVTAKFNGAETNRIWGQNVGTYTAIITIKDTSHYVWADDMNAVDGKATVSWTITKDTKDNDGTYFTVGAIADTTYGETITKTDPTAKGGYGSSFTWYFADKGSLTDATQVADWTEWTESSKPTNAGNYFVKVVLSDTSDGKVNFTDKVGYSELSIAKATLHITLSGTIEYGNAFDSNKGNRDVVESDLLNGDTDSVIQVTSGMSYYLVDDKGNPISKLDKLEVDSYNLTALTQNGFVVGLAADNYNIVLADGYGVFTVTPQAITVTIGNASGQYGLKPVLTGVEVTYDGIDSAEVIDGVKAALTTTADETSVVRDENYTITSTYKNKNFTITYDDGTYTVTARVVTVTLDNTNAGGTYGSSIGEVTFTVNDDGNGLAALVAKEFAITVVYYGTAYDGTDCGGKVPSHAGLFTANVVGDASNKNFALTAPTSVSLEVKKIVVDSSKITAESQMYTGEGLDPIIIDKDYNVNDAVIYTVNYDKKDLVEAKTHDLTLELVDAYNYAWNSLDNESATAIIKFVIAGAGIYAIPYAEAVEYGATYEDIKLFLKFKLVYASGVNKGKDASADVQVVGDGVKYVFVDKDALGLNLNQLAAGTYRITLETVNGFVVGLESTNDNYSNIALELDGNKQIVYGSLEIKPRKITITVNNSSSIYSEEIKVTENKFEITEGNLVFGEDKDVVINFNITANTSGWINAGPYSITATATADNYDVNVVYGTHTINPIKVSVVVTAEGGTYLDNPAATVSVEPNADLVGYKFPEDFETKLTRKITGSKGYDSSAIPTNAGSYTVTVTGINDGNYEFVFTPTATATFTIAKKEVNQNAITVNSKEYTGAAQSHDIVAIDGVYTVLNGVYKDANIYDVTLELVDPDNYTWKDVADRTVIKQFEITKATLKLTPYGSAVYGNGFSPRFCGYTLAGFKPGDDEKVVHGSVINYSLIDEPDKLTVKEGGYELAAQVDMSAINYVIEVVSGTFTVVKRSISIRPVASTSVYSQEIVLSKYFEVVIGSGSFVYDDDESVITYGNVQSTATANPKVGTYPVTASASADNYAVTVNEGTHTIEQIKISVDLHVTDGVYGEKDGKVSYLSPVATNLIGEPTVDGLTFTVKFSGKTNGGITINSSAMPKLAGMYRATIVGIDDSNYTIDNNRGIRETVFEIAKKSIDVRDITAQSAGYSGKAIRPVIIDELNDTNAYIVNYGEDYANGFVNVGVYDLTLRLRDTDNYCWLNNLNPYATIKFEITKANNAIVDNNGNVSATAKIEIADWTIDDVASKPQVKLLNGNENDITFEYSANEQGGYSTVVPTVAGTYWVRAFVAESNNYNAYTSAPVSFVIHKRVVAMPSVVNNGASVYTGEMLSLDIANYDDKVMSLNCELFTKNANGVLTLSALNAGTYTARLTLRDSSSYDWADSSKLVDGAVVVTWTIERQVLKVIPSNGSKLVVNGEDIVFIPEGYNSGIMTIRDNVHAHEGHYSAVITLKDKANYAWEGIDGDTITVEFELTGTNTAFIAVICVVAGLCVGLGVMALILTLVNRNKKRRQAAEIDERSRADGWEGE